LAETAPRGALEQLGSFERTFWLSNVIEMCERLSYYGLRVVLPIYMLLAVEQGGPQFTNIQKGEIYAIWAAIQSFVPVFSGGYADRFGFKPTIAASVLINVSGFLTMAYAMEIASWMTGGASVGAAGHPAVYNAFLAGACLLALGTAVFKPGIQGLIASQITEETGSFAWGIFYQVVNIGGFLGPYMAGVMRLLEWRYVFFACAGIACLNLIWLLFVKEPARKTDGGPGLSLFEFGMVAIRGMGGILEPRLFGFLAIFSGFWSMFYQLYDMLPIYIDDWVDSTAVYQALVVPIFALFGSTPPEAWHGNVSQEHMINVNSLMIMTTVSGVGYLSGRFRSMTNMSVGIAISACGILLLDTNSGWRILMAIVVFSLGEMLASPTKMRYVADLATPEKKALYLGYVNATVGIGWTIGSWIAGPLYEATGDKVALARKYLETTVGQDHATVAAIPKSEVITRLGEAVGKDAAGVRDLLWSVSEPATVWYRFAEIGLVSMVGMFAFDRLTRAKLAQEQEALVVLIGVVTGLCYGPGWGALFAAMAAGRLVLARAMGVGDGPDLWRPGAWTMGVVFACAAVYKAAIYGGLYTP
jgi:dipeptide/tripeptide permease